MSYKKMSASPIKTQQRIPSGEKLCLHEKCITEYENKSYRVFYCLVHIKLDMQLSLS